MRLEPCVLALLFATAAVHAQIAPADADWKEAEAPPPPAVRTTGLIPLEIPRSNLSYGVDPASVSVAPDGVVRYVVVAASPSGAVNALYEGVRCSTGEFKVYARSSPGSGWRIVKETQWRSLRLEPVSRHSLLVARTGACMGHGVNRSVEQIVRDLRAPVDTRFN